MGDFVTCMVCVNVTQKFNRFAQGWWCIGRNGFLDVPIKFLPIFTRA
jgi:hypothetical protein